MSTANPAECGVLCGVACDNLTYAEHLASVVAALPNIATVMLPEPTVREYGGLSWGADEDGEYPTVTATPGYDTVRLYVEDARHTREDGMSTRAVRSAGCKHCGRHIEQVDGDRWRHMYPYWDHMLSCEPKLRRDPQNHTMAEPDASGVVL